MGKFPIEKLYKSKGISFFLNKLESDTSLLLEKLNSSSIAFIASAIYKKTNKNIVLITHETNQDSLYQDLCFFEKDKIVEFPAWDMLSEKENNDIIGKRMHALHEFASKKPKIILTTFLAAMQKLPEQKQVKPLLSEIKINQTLGFDAFIQKLDELGYRRETIVSDKGEFAIRGGIIDVFPNFEKNPFRIEFFGDMVEQIRAFDIADQKSIEKVSSFFLSPCEEKNLLEDKTSSLFDYLEQDYLIIFDDISALEDNYIDIISKTSAIKSKYLTPNFFQKISQTKKIYLSKEPVEKLSDTKVIKKEKEYQTISFSIFDQDIQVARIFHPFITPSNFFFHEQDLMQELQKEVIPIYFIHASEKEAGRVQKQLPDKKNYHFFKGYLSSGFVISDLPLAIIPDAERTKKKTLRRQNQRNSFHSPEFLFHSLAVGDSVVHSHSGIGKFLGVEKQKNSQGIENDYMKLEFAKNSILYVPISDSHLISRYIGADQKTPDLSILGSKKWQSTKIKVEKQIVGYAKQLLELYAERSYEEGFSYLEDSEELHLFEQDFPYHETTDQLNAINAVKEDMQLSESMDRLICGDVGYGKTEVAMRAAAKAVFDGGKQVAVLVPTTVLAIQHYESFIDRMSGYPLNIETLNRFQKPSKCKQILEDLKQGKVDIVIGTHRILSKDVFFKDLGLIIIDEEQRFGVKAKEHLKTLKKGVDCLTLSATPIPRTLYMSLIQTRKMSVINTPPMDRLPIQTIIAQMEDELIQNALQRELAREGQAYILHNRVESIYERKSHIQKLIPKASIGIAHGQMSAKELDMVFHAFKLGQIDILIATTIIENGIDIPNANTILIEKAYSYGLADLYQLRGRVGRWNRSAYAYLLIPKHKRLEEDAKKRLLALVENSGFGGGMRVAMRDLEIRGAGDILGIKQSGQISSIGFHLYCKLLKRTIEALKNKTSLVLTETKLEFPFEASLPDNYIKEPALRMEIYHRLGESSSYKKLHEILLEIHDRFGKPPISTLFLYYLSKIRIFAQKNRFIHLRFGPLSLYAKQAYKQKIVEKTILFPKKPTSPKALEELTLLMLKQNFTCKSDVHEAVDSKT